MMLRIKTALFGISLMLLSGCASTEPSRFYTLTPMPGSNAEVLTETVAQNLSVGVGPISMPDYLDRQQIVTSSNQNEIKMSEFDRWAGSLEDSLARVLSENLSVLLSTDSVFLFPWRGAITVDYHIGVEVIQFDGELGGNALLIARWGIFSPKEKKVLLVKKSSFTEPAGEKGYEALVAAQSRALMHLSRDMAIAVKSLSQRVPGQ
jgi:uncharacterized lipoprotein YmbA